MCLGLFLIPQDTAIHGEFSDFSPCDPSSGQCFFHTVPNGKSCVCIYSPSLELLNCGADCPSEVMQGNTAFSIFGLWEQRSSKAKESLFGPSLKSKEEGEVQRQSDTMGQAGLQEPGGSQEKSKASKSYPALQHHQPAVH